MIENIIAIVAIRMRFLREVWFAVTIVYRCRIGQSAKVWLSVPPVVTTPGNPSVWGVCQVYSDGVGFFLHRRAGLPT